MDLLHGKQVVISEYITKEVRCRTHKKRRINKKWLKRYGYKSVPDNSKVYVMGDKIIMTQKAYDKLRDLMEVVDEKISSNPTYKYDLVGNSR